MLILVSDKGTVLVSQLGSGTNTTAALPPGASASNSPNGPQINGGGSAEGNRGGSSADSPSTTGFQQGGEKSQSSNVRGISHIVAVWSGVMALMVGGMFTLL
jgi:hypothetical protein